MDHGHRRCSRLDLEPHEGATMRVLVGYASEHHSTAEIAERIGARIRARGITKRVDVSSLDRARSAIEYDAVVLGSAIHDRKWLPMARAFVFDNARALASRPVWLFGVGMAAALPATLQRWAKKEGAEAIAALPSPLDPTSTRLFSGVLRKDHLAPVGRAAFALFGGHYGDFRDWEAIDAWADEIADALAVRRPDAWSAEPEADFVGLA